MTTNSRQKGKRGELEAAAELRRLGFDGARRGQQFRGGPDSPDIADAIPGVHLEVKRTETLSVYKAMEQAEEDSRHTRTRIWADGHKTKVRWHDIPAVLHKRNRKDWLAVVRLDDLPEFCRRVLGAMEKSKHP